MFLVVKYRAIDYNHEASALRRMTLSSLALPVPLQLDNNVYPHSCRLQDDSYRRPWCGGLCTPFKLEYTHSVFDCLREELCAVECVERFRVCTGELGEDVVPSSNPASPRCVESQEALRLLKGGGRAADQDEWTESFSEVDLHSVYFSEQDLFLPEEVFISDNQLKSFLPSLTTMLKRLKPYPVSHLLDRHQTGSLLYEHLMIREFSLYSDVPYKGPVSSSSPQYDVEEFGNEMILGAEDLMLPDFIETDVPQNQELITCSLIKHREALNLTPEPVEEHGSVLEALLKGVVTSSEWETFRSPVMDITDSACERTVSPLPFRSYVELEMDLILSPPPPPPPPPPSPDWKLFVSTSQLSAETLSPVDRVCLLSDRECEVLENEVWVAEKHTQEVVRLLLAEPEIPAPQEHQHSLPELLSCLHAEPQCDDTDRSCYPSLLPLMTPDPILAHTLAVETHTAVNTHRTEVDTMEQFTPLTLTQIDELVGECENMVSPAAENRDMENAVPARICKSKTVTFILQEHDSPKRETEEKVCVSSKTSSDAVCSSARNTPTDPADVSDNKAKHKILLKSGPKPVPYSHSQENPQNTGALSHPVRGTDTSTSLLRSTPHTATHTPLRKENSNTFSESVTHQTGNFRLHSTHSAHKPSAENTAVDRRLSVCYTPRKQSASAQRDLPLENRHVTDHHYDPATHRKAPSPNLEHAYSNKDTATDLLQTSPTHQLSQDVTEQEDIRVQQEKKTSTTSTSHTQSFPSNHTSHLSDLLPENPSKNSAVLEPLSTPHTYGEIVSHIPNAASHTPKHQNSGQTLTPTRSPHQAEEQTPDSGPRSGTGMKRARLCVQRPQEFLDPVSSFMMLRGVLRFQLEQRAEETPQCTTDKQTVAESSQESTLKPTDGLDKTVVEQATEKKKKNPESSCPVPERSTCESVHVPPTDTEKRAYWELHALVPPVLYRALSSGSLSNTDFSSLTPEHTRVCLKEQEKLLAAGRGKECDYNNVALLHILVTLKDLLLRCDLNTATGHLEEAHSTCTIDGLGELLRKFQVLQYLSRKWAEPWLRVQHLQEHISTWLQRTYDQKILIVIAVENVRAELVMALNQIPGNSVAALIPQHDSRVNFKNLINSRCVVVCVQHLQCGFPWWRFSTVLEFQCSGDSAVRSICTKNKINYTCFTTAAPCTDPGPLAMFCPSLDCVPFVLFITEGLLKYRDLLQLLESTYNMTLLERIHSPSLSQLGPTHLYDIITVDENTAILVQELRELEHERAAERVVLRLSALSLQFSCCWLLLHFSDDYSALVRGEVFSNLTLIYSALLLFGQKSDGLDLKVLLVLNVAEIAHCVHQVCLHTLLNSQREVCVWLEREWFSILPTEEEQFLLCFPCVNSVVAQLLLNRAPSLKWLLEASHTQLEEMFPEITPSVIKLFSDITAAHRLSAAATQCEDESAHMHSWGLDEEEPLSHTPPSLNPFCINSSIVTHTPRFIQEPGTLGNGHFGEESECFMSTHLSEEQTQGADFSGVGDEYADEQWNPSLSFTHSHTVPSTPFTQNPLPHPTPPFTSHSTHQQWRGMSAAQTPERYTERKRPGGGGLGMVFPHSKRGRLLFERVPGRSDGQTRLRFF